MADSSAIDDTLAEARDLLLGNMATHVLDDINGHIHAAVPGFHDAFFLSSCRTARECQIRAQDSMRERPAGLWKDGTALFVKRSFVDDLFRRIRDLPQNNEKQYVGRQDPRLESMDFQGKPDVVLVPNQHSQQDANPRPIWYDVQVLGSVREPSSRGYQQAFLQLCHQAQTVFQHQPTRRFLHAFSVYGFTLEFLVFDRAGVISSEPIDLRQRYGSLLDVLYLYAVMSNELLGVGSFVMADERGTYVELPSVHGNNTTQRLYTDAEPIAWPANLLTRPGAYCLQAKTLTSNSADVVVKFVWEPPSKRREIEILNHATRSGVWGVPQVLGHNRLASTQDIRKGLCLGPKREVSPQSVQRPSLGEEMFKEKKEKLASDHFDIQRNCLASNTVLTEDAGHCNPKASSVRSAEQFELTCIATTPHGRPLSSFASIPEVLHALRDAAKAHRSLYEKAGILHCDISSNNIIIPDVAPARASSGAAEEAPRGILIDFDESIDMAAERNSATEEEEDDKPSDPGHQVIEIRGTRPFIATSLMLGTSPSHTYLHDLESLLYVLVHLAICNHSHEPPMTSCLNGWATMDDWRDLGRRKEAMVKGESGWRKVRGEFGRRWETAGVGDLADELRGLIFEGTGGDGEGQRGEIYEKVVEAFERAIRKAEVVEKDDHSQ